MVGLGLLFSVLAYLVIYRLLWKKILLTWHGKGHLVWVLLAIVFGTLLSTVLPDRTPPVTFSLEINASAEKSQISSGVQVGLAEIKINGIKIPLNGMIWEGNWQKIDFHGTKGLFVSTPARLIYRFKDHKLPMVVIRFFTGENFGIVRVSYAGQTQNMDLYNSTAGEKRVSMTPPITPRTLLSFGLRFADSLSVSWLIWIIFTGIGTQGCMVPWVGLPLLLLGNYFLRHTLDKADLYINNYLNGSYPHVAANFYHLAWWEYLVPCQLFGGACPGVLMWTYALENVITAPGAWYLLHALIIILAFTLSWVVFRSFIFSYTLALCLGFGTQLNYTYNLSGSVSALLYEASWLILFFCGYQVIQSNKHQRLWMCLFTLSLFETALTYEGWLDFGVVFGLCACFYLFFIFQRQRDITRLRRLTFVAGMLVVVGVGYIGFKTVGIKLIWGLNPHSNGSESDIIFNYPHISPMIEDVISNYMTHLYMVVTNFIPPPFFTSNSYYLLGAEKLIEYQYNYHAAYSYLVPMSYHFLWRYYAGAVFVIFMYFLFKVISKSLKTFNSDKIALSIFMIMAAVGGPTHMLVKIRPMTTEPVLGYHVLVGVLGISLVIAYLLLMAQKYIKKPYLKATIIVGIWSVILYSALARPAYLQHLSQMVGLSSVPTDPLRELLRIFGVH
ncbi:MAG: hypothetical protein MUO64_04905 [Anaerolineales bacterium]|nr:hypothetical protein [Anaerolineales bacterium]